MPKKAQHNNNQIKPVKRKKGAKQAAPVGFLNTIERPVEKYSAPIVESESRRAFARVSSVKNKMYGDAIKVHGQDLLSRGLFSTTGDSLLVNLLVAIQELSGTRLQLWGQMYEKFLFKKLAFHVTPSAPTTSSGSYVLAYDRDPTDPTPSASLAGSKALMSYEGSCDFPIWTPGSIYCPLIQPTEGFYTGSGSDERLFTQGQLYIWQLDPASSALPFTVWVEYECEFYVPQLDQPGLYQALQPGGSFTPSTYIATSPTAPYTLYDVMNAAGTTLNGSIARFGQSPSGDPGFLMNSGDWAIKTLLGNDTPVTIGSAGTLSNILHRLVAVNQKEQALATITTDTVKASSSAAGSCSLQSESSAWISVPPGGAWLTAALSSGAFSSAISGLICLVKIYQASRPT